MSTQTSEDTFSFSQYIMTQDSNQHPFVWIGNSDAIRLIAEKIARIRKFDRPVLVQGEAGSGRTHLAKYIHLQNQPDLKHFYTIDVLDLSAEIPTILSYLLQSNLLLSEEDKHFYLPELTVFVKNIESIEPPEQRELIKILSTHKYQQTDGQYDFSKVLFIFAALPELDKQVQSGNISEQFYTILTPFRLRLPPLRTRKQDIAPLVNHYLAYYSQKYNKNITGISKELSDFLLEYSWPGNVQQLLLLFENLILWYEDGILQKEDIPTSFFEDAGVWGRKQLQIQEGVSLKEYEKQIILTNLRFVDGNRARASELLGISERTLYRKIKEYGFEENTD